MLKRDHLEQHTRKEITPISPPDEEDPSRLTPQDLEKLQYAKEIHDFLQYPQLRDIITKLDTSKQPEKDLDLIRAQDPVFDEFTKLLVDITFKDKLAAFQQKKWIHTHNNNNNSWLNRDAWTLYSSIVLVLLL